MFERHDSVMQVKVQFILVLVGMGSILLTGLPWVSCHVPMIKKIIDGDLLLVEAKGDSLLKNINSVKQLAQNISILKKIKKCY